MNKLLILFLFLVVSCVPTEQEIKTYTSHRTFEYEQARKEWLEIKEKHLAMKDSLSTEFIMSSLSHDMKIWCKKWDIPYETFKDQIEK